MVIVLTARSHHAALTYHHPVHGRQHAAVAVILLLISFIDPKRLSVHLLPPIQPRTIYLRH